MTCQGRHYEGHPPARSRSYRGASAHRLTGSPPPLSKPPAPMPPLFPQEPQPFAFLSRPLCGC